MPNKPNSPPHGTPGRLRQTNPIARSGAPRRCRGTDRPGQRTHGTNKPNLPQIDPKRHRRREAQEPLGRGQMRQTNPIGAGATAEASRVGTSNYGALDMERGLAKTEPIARGEAPRRCPGGTGGTGPQGRGTQGNRAKQTQSRRRERQRQVLRGKGVMVNNTSDRHWQNKANSRRCRAGRGSCTNRPNSCRNADREIAVPGRAKCATSPRCPASGNEAKLGQDGASGGTVPQGGANRAEQSQFVRPGRSIDSAGVYRL